MESSIKISLSNLKLAFLIQNHCKLAVLSLAQVYLGSDKVHTVYALCGKYLVQVIQNQ